MGFKQGTVVEVCSDEDGLKDSYYLAFIHRCLASDTYEVQYTTLLEDDGSNRPLIEIFHGDKLRPLPDPEARRNVTYELNDVVDAYDRDGWWKGVVTKVNDEKSYVVYFDIYECEIEYEAVMLRPHQEWINGEWVTSEPSPPKSK